MMGLKRTGLLGSSVLAALLLAACGSTVKLDETPVESRTPTPVGARVTTGSGGNVTAAGAAVGAGAGAAQSQVATVDLSRPAAGVSAGAAAAMAADLGRTVYFDFDSFVVKDEFQSLIEGHARALAANKARRMVVEGHTDERGGREYNLALGQKRAEAVVKSLALLGVGEGQLEAVSYGKERPVAEGHDEDAWAKNRRAELKDR